MTVRDGSAADAEAVAGMCNALAAATGMDAQDMTPEAVRRDLVDDPAIMLIVAEQAGKVVGYAFCTAGYESAYAARGLYLSDLFVKPQARRQGVARAILAEVARRAKARGGSFVWWVVAPSNDPAAAFYDRLGAVGEEMRARALYGPAFERLASGGPTGA